MTSISPDRSTAYDHDLSTLTNLRINNRRSKQRLLNRVLQDDTLHNNNVLGDTTSSLSSPIKRFSKSSPIKKRSASSFGVPSSTIRKERYAEDSPIHSYDRYDWDYTPSQRSTKQKAKNLDDNLERMDYRINELKRERFINRITSPTSVSNRGPSKENQSIYSFKSSQMDDDTFKRFSRFGDHYMRPSTIPELAPTKNSKDRLRDRISIHKDNDNNDVLKSFRKLNLQKDKIPRDTDLDKLLDDTIERDAAGMEKHKPSMSDYDVERMKELRSKVAELQSKKTTFPSSQKQDKEVIEKNAELQKKIDELNSFINFLESNFDKVYKKSHYYKLRKDDLERSNQELALLNEYYRKQLVKYEKNERSGSNVPEAAGDSTTYNLMSFQ